MLKFGLFDAFNTAKPIQVFHANYMAQDGEYVRIFNKGAHRTHPGGQVGALRLDKGQYVKQIVPTRNSLQD
jgi:hypothetical protein